jgi:hypothetical protein
MPVHRGHATSKVNKAFAMRQLTVANVRCGSKAQVSLACAAPCSAIS